MTRRRRVLLIHNMITPYRLELFRTLSRIPEWDFRVVFTSARESDRSWTVPTELGFDAKVLKNVTLRWQSRHIHLNPGLPMAIARFNPDVIISGNMGVPSALALAYAFGKRIPFVLWWAGNAQTEASLAAPLAAWRRQFVRQIAGAVTYSTGARSYLVSLGVPPAKIRFLGNATFHSSAFAAQVEQHRSDSAAVVAREGLPATVILFVGQLVERKNPLVLPRVALELKERHPTAGIVIIGTGPLAESVRKEAARLGVSDRVVLLGHREPAEMPRYYALARVLLHPTRRDHWSQVVNEAAAAALPIVTTAEEGAVGDLIVHGETGLVVEPTPSALAGALDTLLADPARAARIGQTARRTLARQDLDHAVATFQQTVESATQPA
jgi:glycosyltransferase involved in cell wall biosynthesis